MRLLVVGANGLLGSAVVAAGRRRNWDVRGTFHSTRPDFEIPLTRFDLREHAAFAELLDRDAPDAVVNCAAMTDVDACEDQPARAQELNGEAPGTLAAACEAAGVEFVHVSTDYVFDGTADEPYSEAAVTNPVQVYGESKAAGERAVREASETALLPRLSFVWGIHRGSGDLAGLPAWVRERLRSGADVPLFTDQWVTPTRAGQAAETILALLEGQNAGVYHVACRSCVTPYDFGELLVEHLDGTDGGAESLVAGSLADVERAATRPRRTCLDVEKVGTALGRPQPTLREDVAAVREVL